MDASLERHKQEESKGKLLLQDIRINIDSPTYGKATLIVERAFDEKFQVRIQGDMKTDNLSWM